MGILDLFRAPTLPAPEPVHIKTASIPRKRAVEASLVSRLTSSWNASNLSADEEMRRAIERTRARSRDLAYNNEYAKKFLQMCATHIAGPAGFTLQSLAMDRGRPDRLARDAIELAFWRWAQRGVCEASGRMSFAELQRLLVKGIARDGEALVLRRRQAVTPENPYGYTLKVLEIDRLPVQKNETLKNGNKIVMGVELNTDGRAVAYWLNLGELDAAIGAAPAATTLTRLPAEDVLHLYNPERAEQHRGLPWMHPVMTGLKMLAGYEEAAITAARVGAAKMGFFTSPDGTADALADDNVNGEFYTDAEPGAFSVLPQGYKFEQWDPDYPHQGYEAFVKARLRSIASGLGIAYHTLANDLADVNYSSSRAGTLEERDNWTVLQNWFADAFLRPVFADWLAQAMSHGAIVSINEKPLPIGKQPAFAEHAWQGRRWQWVDPMKDIEAARLAIKSGIASPQQIAAQNGVDVEDVLAQIAQFEDRVRESKVKLVDYELTADKTPVAPTAPTPDPGMREAWIAMARSFETPREPASVNVNVAPPHITLNQAEVRVDVQPQAITVPTPEIRNEITVQPADVQIAAPEIRNIIDVSPTPVEIRAEIDLPAPEVTVNLPSRKTETTIERDANGNIVSASQIETDA